jgi:hypothetical protein
MTDLDAKAFERGWQWQDNPTLPAFFHSQPGETAKPFVLNGVRQQPRRQLSGGTCSERTQPQPILQFDGMTSAVPFRDQIVVDPLRADADLVSDECEERSRRSFIGAQWTTRITQVAKHERMTKAVVIATAAPDRR